MEIIATRIQERGRAIFKAVADEKPSVFDRSWWTGRIMDRAMHNHRFKVQLFRFIDVLPTLTSTDSLVRHIEEYFTDPDDILPASPGWRLVGKLAGNRIMAMVLGRIVRRNLHALARQFIIGRTDSEAIKNITTLRTDGFAFTVDILGEATLSRAEEKVYLTRYLDLLEALAIRQNKWASLASPGSDLDWGHAPKINIAVKPTTLFSQADPKDFDASVAGVVDRFRPLLQKARESRAFVCIDMEQYRFKDITIAAYKTLRASPEFRDYPHLGLALQCYLRSAEKDLEGLLSWAKNENLPISVRLVKGAYWDYENATARQNGWESPVFADKKTTDACFERLATLILANHEICHLACASHNIRSIAAVLEQARATGVPDERYEFQVLYGMAVPIRRALLRETGRVRLYCPFGEMLPGMSYLVRRLLENTANDSFLRQSFAEHVDQELLLLDPAHEAEEDHQIRREPKSAPTSPAPLPPFANEPAADFTRDDTRSDFLLALETVRSQLGRNCPLIINGEQIHTAGTVESVNPAAPDEIIGRAAQCGQEHIEQAIRAAEQAQDMWRETPPEKRAAVLFKAAEKMRRDIFTLAAWQILEVGKQWDQAHADIAEAIDFLEYYGREMIRLSDNHPLGQAPGESNLYFYQPRGITAVIAPWNFPLAISCGMCAAALVTGNPVLYKPSNLSPVTGALLAEIFLNAGLPSGLFHFLPGRGEQIGDFLVDHPAVALIAFTGSREIGQRIARRASEGGPGQRQIKRVIAELGGKNAIIIDDDADLDEAVSHVLRSAFGFQGQKCSACSRVIVVDSLHDIFAGRLREAAASLSIGPAENPTNVIGPMVSAAAMKKTREYISIGKEEGELLLETTAPESGYYAPLAIFTGILPQHRLAQEEIFGPVLSLMRANSFSHALELANSTPYALTGGVFSRSPRHLEQARKDFRVGNLYLNRGITGALVNRQPFGGFKMSGIGSKAGGPDYLLQFMEPRTVTENTMRRGFAPEIE